MNLSPERRTFNAARDAKILKLHAQGLSNPVIAERMGIRPARVSQVVNAAKMVNASLQGVVSGQKPA